MTPSDEGAEIGGAVNTEAQQAEEQAKPVTKSFQEQLTEAAKQIGIPVQDEEEKAPVEAISAEPEPDPEPESEIEGDAASGDNDAVGREDESDDEESGDAPAEGVDAAAEPVEEQDKADKKVPLSEVLKEREKRKRFEADARTAAERATQLEAELAAARAPRPTVKDPFADVMTLPDLKRQEDSLLALIADAARVPKDAEEIPVGDGKVISREEFMSVVEDAKNNLQIFIPRRKEYLAQRAEAEAQATVPYPELKEDGAFKKEVDAIMQLVLSGEAATRPDLRLMCARAVRGYQYEMTVANQKNGNGTSNGEKTTEKIVKSAKQKIAPTPVKSRSVPDRKSASVNLEKAKQAFEKKGDAESALRYYEAQQQAAANPRSLAPIRG